MPTPQGWTNRHCWHAHCRRGTPEKKSSKAARAMACRGCAGGAVGLQGCFRTGLNPRSCKRPWRAKLPTSKRACPALALLSIQAGLSPRPSLPLSLSLSVSFSRLRYSPRAVAPVALKKRSKPDLMATPSRNARWPHSHQSESQIPAWTLCRRGARCLSLDLIDAKPLLSTFVNKN